MLTHINQIVRNHKDMQKQFSNYAKMSKWHGNENKLLQIMFPFTQPSEKSIKTNCEIEPCSAWFAKSIIITKILFVPL